MPTPGLINIPLTFHSTQGPINPENYPLVRFLSASERQPYSQQKIRGNHHPVQIKSMIRFSRSGKAKVNGRLAASPPPPCMQKLGCLGASSHFLVDEGLDQTERWIMKITIVTQIESSKHYCSAGFHVSIFWMLDRKSVV